MEMGKNTLFGLDEKVLEGSKAIQFAPEIQSDFHAHSEIMAID